jgi:hypothetical protein
MFMWNAFVALHTFEQFSETKRQEVLEHYHRILAANQVDPLYDLALAIPDPFWLSVTLSDMGIAPMLGPKVAKWFYVVDPRGARNRTASRPLELMSQVKHDIQSKYGISIQLRD